MGPIDFSGLLTIIAVILMVVMVTWGVLALLYAWITKKVMLHYGHEPLSIKKMWKTYLLILFVYQILSFIVNMLMGYLLIYMDYFFKLGDDAGFIVFFIYSLIKMILGIFIFTWLLSRWIKDSHRQTLSFKRLSLIAIVAVIIQTLLVFAVRIY